ncbi:MAG: sensor histidine kinase, partial [Candidatus Binatia bacterium]
WWAGKGNRCPRPASRLLFCMGLPAESHAPSVLVVDHDVARLATTRGLLEGDGHPVVVARDAAMAVAAADASIGVLIVADELPLVPCRRLVGVLRERLPALQVILHASPRSGEISRETVERLGIHAYVHAGDGPERFLVALDAALRSHGQVAQAQAADRLKMELLASVSHEFRSPLHIILGYLELAREGAFGPRSDGLEDALAKIAWNAGYLLELVEDFLDLAKLESSTIKVEHVDVGALVRALVGDHELLVQSRPIVLRADVQSALPPVLGEGAKLRVIVQNLLTNALKFTERGEIVVTADSPLPGVVQVRVRDTGPGIPPEACESVFDLFRQLQPGDMRRKGIGLGLALARRFARAMDGDLTVESTLGAGSTFTITLPAAEPFASVASPADLR